MRRELVPSDRAIWQSETAKTYTCPFCRRFIRSQYEGEELPTIVCSGPMESHVLEWETRGKSG